MSRLRRYLLALVGLVTLLLAVLLHIDNAEPVQVRFLTLESAALPLFWWLLASFAAGVGIGFLCTLPRRLRKPRSHRRIDRASS
ncbi:MAG: LapA family protein [Gammaproteobacteria bacterium]|nr:LapA family protein [Gammaproteobacteria bacterium]